MAVAEQDLRLMRSQRAVIAAASDHIPTESVRYRRLVIDQPGLQVATDVHPTLTVVVVPTGQVDRTSWLVQDSLRGDEAGVHVELVDRRGRNLLLFRPHGGRSRIVDLDAQVEALPPSFDDDVSSDDFTLDERPPVHVDMSDTWSIASAEAVAQLSAVDQIALWSAADRLGEAQLQTTAPAHTTGPGRIAFGEEPAIVEAIGEARRRRRSGLVRRPHRTRHVGAATSTVLEEAVRSWRGVAGEVPLPQALTLRFAVEACARARSRTVALAAVSSSTQPTLSEGLGGPSPVAVVAEVLAAVLTEAGSLPQALVLPPPNADPAGLQLLLDVLPDLLADRQVIAVTSDDDVADWARLEEHAGRAVAVRARTA